MAKHISSYHLSTQFWHAQLQPDMVTNQHRMKLWQEITSSFQLLETYISHCNYHYSCSVHHLCLHCTHHHCNLHLENKDKIKNTAVPEELSFHTTYIVQQYTIISLILLQACPVATLSVVRGNWLLCFGLLISI